MVTPGGEHVHLQLILPSDHPTLEPRHFIDERVMNEHHQDYMFLDCIKFINEVGKWNTPHFQNCESHTILSLMQFITKEMQNTVYSFVMLVMFLNSVK